MMTSFAIGHLAGWLHMSGLRSTVRRLPQSRSPQSLVRGSFLARTASTVALLYLFCLPALPVALVGWWLARCWAVQRWS